MAYASLAERRQRFIDAAIRVISAEGLGAATTRRIAQEADMSLAGLHYCFESKDELICAAWEERADTMLDTMKGELPPGLTFRAAMHEINDRLWALYTSDPGGQVAQYELMFHFIRTSPEGAGRWAFDRHLKEIFGLYEDILRKSGQSLVMDMRTLLRLLTLAIEGALLQFLSYRDADRARRDLYVVQDAILSIALGEELAPPPGADLSGPA